MNLSNDRLPGGLKTSNPWNWVALIAVAWIITACGGSGGSGGTDIADVPEPVATCNPADANTFSECGTLYVGLTDADGDFLSYSVDVVSLELAKANGATVETLPTNARIDFAQYVDLTEFVTAANIPPGTYVAGTITLDYTDADVFVEADAEAKEAVVVGEDGEQLVQSTLRIKLSDRNQLVITRGRPALLTVDFDLAASHVVDIAETPAIAVSDPFIIAEIDPVDTKEIRVRGLFIEANEDEMSYTVAIRPFHHRAGDFGRAKVYVTDDTEFEVNEMMYSGAEGLRALTAAGRGTLSVAQGTLDVAERKFTAKIVLAGSSVPGSNKDAVKGNIIARNGNELTVRGGTVILSDERAFFRDDVTVLVGPDTKVFKRGFDQQLDIGALSIGQAVTVRGTVTVNDETGLTMDATAGAVRMHITHLSGIVNATNPGQMDITLHAIDRRRVGVYDFTGTGPSRDLDADPLNYEIATGPLPLDGQTPGQPVVAYGFPTAFGMAPPDFAGRTIVDYSDVRSALGVGWGTGGTIAPFLSTSSEELVLDNFNADIDQRHYIKQGPVLIDLTTLDAATAIVPPAEGRTLYSIKTRDSLQLYANFAEFVTALEAGLDGATTARAMYARGQYDVDTNTFTAWKIGVLLLEPST
ncbi:MAG: DUF4382 domain-containing protein [Woeseia sp.]|nr:DUF4382 domain-containing protein [Woeseia sp.]